MHRPSRTLNPALCASLWLLAAHASVAADADSGPILEPIVITATRVPTGSHDLPMSVDLVDQQQIRQGQLLVNLSEPLTGVPGVNAQTRQNYAQDLQISVRGFGARSSFGVRGVRLYADGIPGTMPDGQGQFSNFDLGSADRVEVLRGPFSALYGNSSGGVISIFTQDAPPGERIDATAEYGSFGAQRYALRELLGQQQGVNLVVDASQFATDGYRQHSRTQRDLFNAKSVWQPDAQSKFTLLFNAIDQPLSQDPLGLTATQLAANREQAGSGALSYNTRKTVQQQQVGGHFQRTVGGHDDLSVLLYGGERDTRQFQAIPMSTESAPTHPGGVIALQNHYWGADAHLTDHRRVADTPLQLTAGLSYDNLDEGRRGFLNFIGDELGVQGTLRRDETDTVYDLDQYLQLQWDPGARWRLLAGFRHSLVDYAAHDHLAVDAPLGYSGVSYGTVSPVGGVTFRAGHGLNLYASYGRGFETPTLDELAYRSTDGSLPGLNFGLKAARSDNYEIGMKEAAAHVRGSLAAFFIRTEDELAVQANAAGRSVYQNIPATQRRGAEAELQGRWAHGWSGQLSYSYLRAVTLQSYMTCLGVPCVPIQISAGHRLPAVPAGALYGAATWRGTPADAWITLEGIGRAQVYANDLNSQHAGGYWLFDLRAGLSQHHQVFDLSESLRLDNLLNRRYVGSVIVNETNSRFFEPEPGRTAYLMVTASLR